MIDDITFLNTHRTWQIVLVIIILAIVFIWKESAEYRTRRFWVKLVVSFFAIVFLALIALKPAIRIANESYKVALVTENYNPQQLDSLKKTYKRLKVLTYRGQRPIFDQVNIPDSVFLLGYGVKPFDLWQLDNSEVIYLEGKAPAGVVRFKYDQRNTVGKHQNFYGQYNNPKKGNKLILEGPGGAGLDSVSLEPGENHKFQLSTRLNVPGKFLFSLVEKDSLGNIYSKNPIPTIVEDRIFLRVLIVNGFPTFETKYLKNYLAELGHQITIRSQITRGRYKYEYFNIEKKPVINFSEKNLQNFDLVIIDASSLRRLRKTAQMALENSVRENGLGIFIQPDISFFKTSKDIGAFNFISNKTKETSIVDFPKIKVSKQAFVFKDEFPIQSIYNNGNTSVLSAYKRIGKGRIGTTVLENTYELLLSGQTSVYKQLWATLIGQVCNREIRDVEWEPKEIMVFRDHPFMFNLRTSIEEPALMVNSGHNIPLQRDIDVLNLWEGVTYPRNLGWNTLSFKKDSTKTFEYFVMDTIHWKSMMNYKTMHENLKYSSKNSGKGDQMNHLEKINMMWFYILFIVCIGYLWLEPKVLN